MIARYLPLALLLAGGPAAADVIYSFEPTSGSTAVFFTVEVTNNAAATSFSLHGAADFQDFASTPDIPLSLAGTGIDQITFNDGGIGQGFNSFASVSLGTLPTGPLYLNPGWIVDINGGPTGVTGYLQYLGEYDDFTISLALPPAVTTGAFATDNAIAYPGCSQAPGCFSGLMDPPSLVPEPASVWLLGLGFVGLLWRRKRHPVREVVGVFG